MYLLQTLIVVILAPNTVWRADARPSVQLTFDDAELGISKEHYHGVPTNASAVNNSMPSINPTSLSGETISLRLYSENATDAETTTTTTTTYTTTTVPSTTTTVPSTSTTVLPTTTTSTSSASTSTSTVTSTSKRIASSKRTKPKKRISVPPDEDEGPLKWWWFFVAALGLVAFAIAVAFCYVGWNQAVGGTESSIFRSRKRFMDTIKRASLSRSAVVLGGRKFSGDSTTTSSSTTGKRARTARSALGVTKVPSVREVPSLKEGKLPSKPGPSHEEPTTSSKASPHEESFTSLGESSRKEQPPTSDPNPLPQFAMRKKSSGKAAQLARSGS